MRNFGTICAALFAIGGATDVADAAQPLTAVVAVDTTQRFQSIDGFGVNFNGVYFRDAQKKLIDLLVDDLGVSIVRFDPYGQIDWETENDDADPQHINWDVFDDRFSTAAFEASWAALRAFNKRGVKVFLNVSGTVPSWMLDDKGKPLEHQTCNKAPNPIHPFTNRPSHLRTDKYAEYAETVVAMAAYARKKAGGRFDWFGPFNETNCYPIEGPRIDPDEVPSVVREIIAALDREGMADVNLVVADQASLNADYFSPVMAESGLMKRIARFSLHQYGGGNKEFKPHFARIAAGAYKDVPIWISEYGDLNDKDRSAENEWNNYCVKSTRRILDLLALGATAGLWWDAFDNYHDHDKHMTYYGLVANDHHRYSPKKRFFAQRQLYRFVRPGAVRVSSGSDRSELDVQAFQDDRKKTVTIVGVADQAMTVEVNMPGGARSPTRWSLTLTTPSKDGAPADGAIEKNGPGLRIRLTEPAVFTLVGR